MIRPTDAPDPPWAQIPPRKGTKGNDADVPEVAGVSVRRRDRVGWKDGEWSTALDEGSIRHVTWRIEEGASIALFFFASHGGMDRTDPNGGTVPFPSFWGPIEREGTPDLFSCWWVRLLSHPDPLQIFLHRAPPTLL